MQSKVNRAGLPVLARSTRRVPRWTWDGFNREGEPKYREAWVIEAGQLRQRRDDHIEKF